MNCVTNGCSGKCCEKFTFLFSLNELNKLIIDKKRKSKLFIRDNGNTQYISQNELIEEMIQVKEMLIFLGETEINPQTEKIFNSEMLSKEDAEITNERLQFHRQDKFYFVKDNKIYSRIYTCKNYDKENKICTIYENRPFMCRDFGEFCKYKGCNYAKK